MIEILDLGSDRRHAVKVILVAIVQSEADVIPKVVAEKPLARALRPNHGDVLLTRAQRQHTVGIFQKHERLRGRLVADLQVVRSANILRSELLPAASPKRRIFSQLS